MTCDLWSPSSHRWEDVCTDFHPHLTIFVEYCSACGLARKVLVWDDGQVEYVYNGYDYEVGE